MKMYRQDPLLNVFQPLFDMEQTLRHNEPKASVQRPAMDTLEDEQAYYLLLDMPGVDKADIEVSWHDEVLSIAAERKAHSLENVSSLRSERPNKRYQRRLEFGVAIDAQAIEAHYTDGVLQLKVPKLIEEKAQPQRIAIQ